MDPLPTITTRLAATQIVARAEALAKKGKLPGFEASPGAPAGEVFQTKLFAGRLNATMIARITENAEPREVSFSIIHPKRPAMIIALVTILSIWPGMWITDSMIRTYIPSYSVSMWITAAWYLPLFVLPVPWVWRKMSNAAEPAAREHAVEQIESLRAVLNSES
ncbi:MAG: hypothetical protein IPK69_11130 [Phycisphaerales bacterium]|nr:MAG: hypothetical protein IPK69_11130 [Phycisphaerales bacterium]